jgi:transcriptional regulator with XRE-family HTH domain
MADESKSKRTTTDSAKSTRSTKTNSKKPVTARKTARSAKIVDKTSSAKADKDAKAATAKDTKTVVIPENADPSLIRKLTSLPGAMADSALRMVVKTTDVPLRVGKALFLKPEQQDRMKEAGQMLKDLREVTGLTRDELSEALDLKDHSLIEAVENGTAILSFELILRLAAVLARHDPIPVILKFTRTYNPELWRILEDWGFGRLSLHFERERHFINIYRRHDAARKLSDEGFERVLAFTRAAFEMALHFAAEQENLNADDIDDEETTDEHDSEG